MSTSQIRHISPEDALSIDYYPGGRPAAQSPSEQKAETLASLYGQLAAVEARLASGAEWVGGASQSYAAVSLRRQIAAWEAK